MRNVEIKNILAGDSYLEIEKNGDVKIFYNILTQKINVANIKNTLEQKEFLNDIYFPVFNEPHKIIGYKITQAPYLVYVFYINISKVSSEKGQQKLYKLQDYVKQLKALGLSTEEFQESLKRAFFNT